MSPETSTCEIPSDVLWKLRADLVYDNGWRRRGKLTELQMVKLSFRLYRSNYSEAISTLHCALENGSDLHVNERMKI